MILSLIESKEKSKEILSVVDLVNKDINRENLTIIFAFNLFFFGFLFVSQVFFKFGLEF
jgi:hypothetical protein